MLATLYNTPDDAETLQHWSFAHQDAHSKINDAIFKATGVLLPTYILDPMPEPGSPEFTNWAQYHQAAHTAFDAILGIEGANLTALDTKEQDQVEIWVRLNAFEHVEAQRILAYPD